MTTIRWNGPVPIGIHVVTLAGLVLAGSDVPMAREAPAAGRDAGKVVEAPATSPAAKRPVGAPPLAVGDRLKITFLEQMDVSGGKRDAVSLQAFYQRVDLSGEFVADQDGTITLPRLGAMQVGGRTVQQVQSDLVVRFAKVTGRSAEVSVIVSERSPVYVVGPVRNAGAVKFVPGMTVLHALALAGGIDPMITRAHQASSLVESLQDVERARKIEDDVRRLQARRSRLEAERDRRDTLIPAKAVAGDMAGEEVRRAVFEAEEKVFKVEQAREREQQREQELVRQQIGAELQALRRKLAYFDGQIKVRQERLGDYQKLRAGGLSTSAPSMMLQTEIADLEGRRQDSLLAITQAEARLAQADSGASKLRAEKEATLTKSLFATEAELASLERALVAARAVLLVRDSQASGGGRRGSEMVYEVVRTGGAGGVATKVDEMASLAPGDILKIGFASTADGSGPTPAGTTGGGARAPAGRRATLEVVPK